VSNTALNINNFKDYHDVTAGSLIHILRYHGVNTGNLFTFVEKRDLQPDISFMIKGRISDNKDVSDELVKMLLSPKYKGKRILLVSDTGTGKSFALTQMVHHFNNSIPPQFSSKAFCLYSCPRRALIKNLRENFEADGHSIMLTGSDSFHPFEREQIIRQFPSLLTTIDHAPTILDSKLRVLRNSTYRECALPGIMITDEIHTLATDSTFKLNEVRDYMIAERRMLEAGGISVHVTATPENLRLQDYDLIIKIDQENHEAPFQKAGFSVLSRSTQELKAQFLRMIQYAAESNKDRKLLVFIEDTDWIEYYCKHLQIHGINAIGIMARKENQRTENENVIIDGGLIPTDVQVILSTTVLSSGVSITNNQASDETWVLCSHNSLNHEATRLIQMSHRFRNKYNAFKIFFQQAEPPAEKRSFLYHLLLEENIRKAENSMELIKTLRRNPMGFRVNLDEMEQQSGIYSDNRGELHVLTPMIEGELILHKTYYNYKNQNILIRELEQRFNSQFVKFDLDFDNENVKEVQRQESAKVLELSDQSSKEVIQNLIEDKKVYDRLRSEYARFGKKAKEGLIGQLKGDAKKDLNYLIENGCNYNVVQQIMKGHLKPSKDNPYSYVKDKKAYDSLVAIQGSGNQSIMSRMYKELSNQLKRAIMEKRELCFDSTTEMDNYLRTIRDRVAKGSGNDLSSTKLDVKIFRKLVNYEIRRSSKFKTTRKFVIIGFKDQQCLIEKYGIKALV